MTMVDWFRRPPQDTPAPPEPATQTPDPVLMRFLTGGGATVELHRHRFTTYFTNCGYANNSEARVVNGFAWQCLGCDRDSEYLPGERNEARDHANRHAQQCRAMPKPGRE